MNRLHRRNKRRKIFWTIITVGVIAFFLYQFISAPIKINNLSTDGVWTTGTVIGTFNNQRNTGSGVDYIFVYNGKQYKGGTAYPELTTSFCESLIGRQFPVIVLPTNIDNNEMLLTKQTFQIYGKEQPDSLKWIEENVMK